MIEVLTVSYNTPNFTEAAIRSVLHHTPNCHVTVFENSDSKPWDGDRKNVTVIDNTHGQIVHFRKMLESYPRKIHNPNDWGSAKHCKSVDCCMDILPQGFILIDSDIIVKRDLTPLWDESVAWVGTKERDVLKNRYPIFRVLPMLCYINVPMCREHGVRYFDGSRCWKLTDRIPERWYDTGASFYYDTAGLPHKEININDYMVHYGNGSWKQKEAPTEWIKRNFVSVHN